MKIAVCDDCKTDLSAITSVIKKYSAEKQTDISVLAFESGIDFLKTAWDTDYDAIFLDILMPEMTGMDVARTVRLHNKNIKIIFLTSSPEFAVESYDVCAYHYLLKPVAENKVYSILEKIFLDNEAENECLKIKTASNIFVIPFRQIVYIEVNTKKLFFHMEDGSIKNIAGKLSTYEEELLKRNEFIKTHRSFIINMSHIRALSKYEIVTETGEKVLVSRSLYQAVRSSYTEFLFKESKEVATQCQYT